MFNRNEYIIDTYIFLCTKCEYLKYIYIYDKKIRRRPREVNAVYFLSKYLYITHIYVFFALSINIIFKVYFIIKKLYKKRLREFNAVYFFDHV